MSHFSVLVKIRSEDVEDLGVEGAVAMAMAPYQENCDGECPEEFLEFDDMDEEYRIEYSTGSRSMVRLTKILYDNMLKSLNEDATRNYRADEAKRHYLDPDSTEHVFVSRWNEIFRVPHTFGIGSSTHKMPRNVEIVDVPFSSIYVDFDSFCADWHGFVSGPDEKTGKYGYWTNPDAKWDYYQVGGRWAGSILLKDGVSPDSAFRGDISLRPGHDPYEKGGRYLQSSGRSSADIGHWRCIRTTCLAVR